MSKNSLQTLNGAVVKQDWEAAARACHRAMSIRPEVVNGDFAGAVVVRPVILAYAGR